MDQHAHWSGYRSRAMAVDALRAALAYGALGLGVAGTAAILPLIVWGLAVRGFH